MSNVTVNFSGGVTLGASVPNGVSLTVDPIYTEAAPDSDFATAVSSGTSSTTTSWGVEASSSISGGQAALVGNSGYTTGIYVSQANSGLVSTDYVEIVIDIESITGGGNVEFWPDFVNNSEPAIVNTIGTHTLIGEVVGSGDFAFWNTVNSSTVVINSISIQNTTQIEKVFGILSTSGSGTNNVTYNGNWNYSPVAGDIVKYSYDAGTGDYSDQFVATPVLLPDQDIVLNICDNPSHILHFPMDETSGTDFTDSITGSVITQSTGTAPTFETSNAVTFYEGNITDLSLVDGRNSGSLLFYSSNIMSATPPVSNAKLGFGHVEAFTRTLFDIQLSTGATNLTTVKCKNTLRGGTATLALTGADNLLGEDYTIACTATIGESSFDYHRLGRTTLSTTTPDPFTIFDISSDITSLTPGDFFEMGPKRTTCYVFGAYVFAEGLPSDAEIQTFMQWVHTQARLGNKDPYPLWIDRK